MHIPFHLMRQTMVRKVKTLTFRNLTLVIYSLFAVTCIVLTALFLNSVNQLEELQKIDRSFQTIRKNLTILYRALKKDGDLSAFPAAGVPTTRHPDYDKLRIFLARLIKPCPSLK